MKKKMRNIRVIYRSSQIKGIEIPSEIFQEVGVESRKLLLPEVYEEIVLMEKRCGFVYYAILYAMRFTEYGYLSSIILDGDSKSLVVMRNVEEVMDNIKC
ncbi:MAG TPA: hypothetical protein PLU73_00925 [Bacteroidia bacterium]|nr:hypothetical protein [Bacteroidia bacterium]